MPVVLLNIWKPSKSFHCLHCIHIRCLCVKKICHNCTFRTTNSLIKPLNDSFSKHVPELLLLVCLYSSYPWRKKRLCYYTVSCIRVDSCSTNVGALGCGCQVQLCTVLFGKKKLEELIHMFPHWLLLRQTVSVIMTAATGSQSCNCSHGYDTFSCVCVCSDGCACWSVVLKLLSWSPVVCW